jgi:uncharacterized protein
MRRRSRILLSIVALYVVLVVAIVGCGLTDKVLLLPSTESVDHGRATRFAIERAGGEIEVWRSRSMYATGAPEAYVLRFYGNADRAEYHAFHEGYGLPFSAELWGVNYPGFGGSAGPATLRGVAESALAAYDAIKAVAGQKPIFVFGTSMGTVAALHIAAHREVAGLFLQNPPPLRQLIRGQYGWWNLWLLAAPVAWGVPEELDSIANAKRARAPAIFLMFEDDDIVGYSYQKQIYDAYAGPKLSFVEPGLRHNDYITQQTDAAIKKVLVHLFTNGKLP